MSQVAHQAGAYPDFLSMKRLGVFLLPPGWDASPSQNDSQAVNLQVPFTHLGEERDYESKVPCQEHNAVLCPGLEPKPLDPEFSALTIRLLHLPRWKTCAKGWNSPKFQPRLKSTMNKI